MGFDHLRKYEIADRTAQLSLPWIEGSPVLQLRPATEANRDYQAAQLRIGRAQLRALSDRPTLRLLDELRSRLRDLYPRHVLVGWEGVVDDNGEAVPFSTERAVEFVNALPDWIFDKIVIFCSEAGNFTAGSDEVMLGN